MARRTIRAPNLTLNPLPLQRGQFPNRRSVLPGFDLLPLHHRHGANGHSHNDPAYNSRTAAATTVTLSMALPGQLRRCSRDLRKYAVALPLLPGDLRSNG